MAANANAPYYQLPRQFTTAGNIGTGTNAHFAPDDDYDLSASETPGNGPASLYPVDQSQDTNAQGNTAEENRQLAELLEAANTAEPMNIDVNMDGNTSLGGGGGKRKRMSSTPVPEGSDVARDVPSGPKRARIDMPTDPSLQRSDTNAQTFYSNSTSNALHSSSATLSDARAAGVHSAAALFRRSSKETSRKYTRPPMSKLFMSLQLTPENFLHLQAQAKVYMLDPSHPDRQSCIGNRGMGDTDMVKLRLFNCVRDFLNDGAGEQFFGEHVEKPGESDSMEAARALGEKEVGQESKLVWPRDGNKIISLVTPLLRRMVTNERQRMYAIETRKGGIKRKEGSVERMSMGRDLRAEYQRQEREQRQRTLEPMNTSTPPPDLHPVQVQTQSQQSHPPSPNSPVPLPDVTPRVMSSQSLPPPSSEDHDVLSIITRLNAGIPSLASNELPLPIPSNSEPILHTINIYLTKCGIKLRPIKRVENDSKVLFEYTLVELKQEIGLLIQLGMSTYPALRPKDVGMGPEALRGLAVAATEMGSGERSPSAETPLADVSNGTVSQLPWSPASPTAQVPSTMVHPESLPYTVQAMRSTGLLYIKHLDGRWDEETWVQVKKDVGHAVWAAGVMTLVVDLP